MALDLRTALKDTRKAMKRLVELLCEHEIEDFVSINEWEKELMFVSGYITCLERRAVADNDS